MIRVSYAVLTSDNVEADMQAVFFAHGPFAKSIKATARRRDGTVKRGWVSTEPHVMESESAPQLDHRSSADSRLRKSGDLLAGHALDGAGVTGAASQWDGRVLGRVPEGRSVIALDPGCSVVFQGYDRRFHPQVSTGVCRLKPGTRVQLSTHNQYACCNDL